MMSLDDGLNQGHHESYPLEKPKQAAVTAVPLSKHGLFFLSIRKFRAAAGAGVSESISVFDAVFL